VGVIRGSLEARSHAGRRFYQAARTPSSRPARVVASAAEDAMDFEWAPPHLAFRDEVRELIRQWRTPELLEEYARIEGVEIAEPNVFRKAKKFFTGTDA